jgi:MFS family permease
MCKGCCKLHPVYLLVFFTLVNVLIYTDRGVLAAVASTIESKKDGLGLEVQEIGAVGSFFMLGYILAGPIFAHYAQRSHPLNLIAIGLVVWGLATSATGYSNSFWTLSLSRALTGVGEASFVCLAPPYILDNAPPSSKTTWIAIFYSAISIGNAVGYVYGNITNEVLHGWFWPFYIESILIIPFILVCICGKKDHIQITSEETLKPEVFTVTQQLKILGKNLTYDFLVLGFAAFIFTMGGLSMWGPYIVEKLFNQTARTANMVLGVIILSSGISGTLIGSFVFDCFMKKYVALASAGKISKETLTNITTEKANFFLTITTFFSMVFGVAGLLFDDFLFFQVCIWFFLFLMYM